MKSHVSIEECRTILGGNADGMTDEQIESMRSDLERMADVLFDQMVELGPNGLEAARWATYFRETGEIE